MFDLFLAQAEKSKLQQERDPVTARFMPAKLVLPVH